MKCSYKLGFTFGDLLFFSAKKCRQKTSLAIAKGLVAPKAAASEIFRFDFNLLINSVLFLKPGEVEIMGIIHFSEELGRNPLRTVHCLSFYKLKSEVQLLSNQSRKK